MLSDKNTRQAAGEQVEELLKEKGLFGGSYCYDVDRVSTDDVIAIGIDFTACTVLPVDKSGTSLCFSGKYRDDPMAYVQLWQHHGAQEEADTMTRLAEQRDEPFLARIGGKVSGRFSVERFLRYFGSGI